MTSLSIESKRPPRTRTRTSGARWTSRAMREPRSRLARRWRAATGSRRPCRGRASPRCPSCERAPSEAHPEGRATATGGCGSAAATAEEEGTTSSIPALAVKDSREDRGAATAAIGTKRSVHASHASPAVMLLVLTPAKTNATCITRVAPARSTPRAANCAKASVSRRTPIDSTNCVVPFRRDSGATWAARRTTKKAAHARSVDAHVFDARCRAPRWPFSPGGAVSQGLIDRMDRPVVQRGSAERDEGEDPEQTPANEVAEKEPDEGAERVHGAPSRCAASRYRVSMLTFGSIRRGTMPACASAARSSLSGSAVRRTMSPGYRDGW